ncbi:MAG: hypothetical protein KUG77_15355, partial [Nannocystaceae bacterium]|nr:hypothetical protein [Nannocystaceae bacterium]
MNWTRRDFVVRAAKTAAALPIVGVFACTDDGADASGTEAGTGEGSSSSTDGVSGTSMNGSGSGTTGAAEPSSTTSSPGGSTTGDTATGTAGSTQTGQDGGSDSEGSTGATVCEPSPEDIEGPFYRPGIPVGGDLDVHGDPGVALRIEGTVLGEGCLPIVNAVVEIWHATPVAPDGEPGDNDAVS